jgi:ATP adenylyltransferase
VVGHVSAAQPGDSAGDEARPPTHVIVLNRFPIIANHFILATMPFKPQDAPLDADDLAATHASIRAWEEQSGVADEAAEEGGPPRKPRLIAFFNMGPLSGASQPHRHVQFLPEEDVRAGMPADDDGASPPWRPLIDMLAGAETTATGAAAGHEAVAPPFVHFREALPRDASPAALHGAYARLLARTRAAWERRAGPSLGEPASRFSCNWAMVRDAVAMCPRTGEGASALDEPGARDGVGGVVAANGAVLVGALVVKRRPEWDVLRREPGALDRVLGGIGVPSASGKHFAESSI